MRFGHEQMGWGLVMNRSGGMTTATFACEPACRITLRLAGSPLEGDLRAKAGDHDCLARGLPPGREPLHNRLHQQPGGQVAPVVQLHQMFCAQPRSSEGNAVLAGVENHYIGQNIGASHWCGEEIVIAVCACATPQTRRSTAGRDPDTCLRRGGRKGKTCKPTFRVIAP